MGTNRKIFSTRFWVPAVLVATAVFGPLSARAANDSCASGSTAGNSKSTATPLNATGNVCAGVVAGQDIWYVLTVNNPAQLEIQFLVSGLLAVVYPPGSTTGVAPTNTVAGVNQPEWRLRAKPGDWYIQVKGAGQFTQYEFHYTVVEQRDCGTSPADAGNSAATESLFNPTLGCAGQVWGYPGDQIPKIDPEDWYKVTLTSGAPAHFELGVVQDRTIGCPNPNGTNPACGSEDFSGVKVELRNPSGSSVLASTSATDNGRAQLDYTPTADGDYLLRLFSNGDYGYYLAKTPAVVVPSISPTIIPSTLIPSTVPTPSIPPIGGVPALTDDCPPATGDAGNTSGSARPIGTPTVVGNAIDAACIGNLGDGDGEDWYSFNANKGQQLKLINGGNGNLDPDVFVFDPSGIIRFSNFDASPIVPALVQGDITSTGTWKIRVARRAGNGNYYLVLDVRDQITAVPSVPGVPSVVPSTLPNPFNGDCNTGGDASNENGSGANTPPTIPANTVCSGSLGAPNTDTADWYSFNGFINQDVVVVLEGEDTLDPNVDLYTPEGVRVFPPNHFQNPVPEYFRYTLTKTGLWRLRVSKVTGAGRYLLIVSNPEQLSPVGTFPSTLPSIPPSGVPTSVPSTTPTVPAVSNGDCNVGGDAGDDLSSPSRISPSPALGCTGTLSATDVEDFFSFNAVVGQRITISEAAEPSLDADLVLYTPYGEQVRSVHAGPQPESVSTIAGATGTYVLRVHRGGGDGEYGLGIYVGTTA